MAGSNTAGRIISISVNRFAPYIEEKHKEMLDVVVENRERVLPLSPYESYSAMDIDNAYLGAGYVLSNFPSLYDMFGKFMAGLDLENIWTSIFKTQSNLSETDRLPVESALEFKDIETDIPKYAVEMRRINAVNSSSFVIGKARIEEARLKALAKKSAADKIGLLFMLNDKFVGYLNWKKDVITSYALSMKAYFIGKMDDVETDEHFAAQNTLWSFFVLDFERAALMAMKAKASFTKYLTPRERSAVSKGLLVASYAATGAQIGAKVGGYYGAIIGAVVGTILGVAQILSE